MAGEAGIACGTSDVTLGLTGRVLSHRLGSRPQHALDQSRGREWALLSDLPTLTTQGREPEPMLPFCL